MSAFQNAIVFLLELGVYDVVLPFLLIFTLFFALLEKTRILGVEEDGTTKKNLNAMIALVAGMMLVASTSLVALVNEVLATSALLVLFSVLFLMLAGTFYKDGEFDLDEGWKKFFMGLMLVGITLLFLNALGWLEFVYNYLRNHIDGPVVGSILLLGVVVAGIVWITGSNSNVDKGGDSN